MGRTGALRAAVEPRTVLSISRYPGAAAFADERAAFIASRKAKGVSDNTIKAYHSALDRWEETLRERDRSLDPVETTRRDVEAFLAAMVERGNKPSSRVTRYKIMRSFFAYLVRVEAIEDKSPFVGVEAPMQDELETPLVTLAQYDALMAVTAGSDFLAKRDRAIIALMLATGARRAEVAGIMVEDLALPLHQVMLHGKGGRHRWARFDDDTAEALHRYRRMRVRHAGAGVVEVQTIGKWTREGEPFFFQRDARQGAYGIRPTAVSQMLTRRCNEAGVGHLHPHQFRHAWADATLESGMEEGDVAELGGWRSRAMLDRYGKAGRSRRAMDHYVSPLDTLRARDKRTRVR